MKRNINLVISDWKIIRRDPMLILCLFAPILLILISVFLFPIISKLTTQFLSFPLERYFLIGKLFLFTLTPMMLGMIYGFIMLDERDGGIISYLSITPIGKRGYLKTRLLMPMLISFLAGILFLIITGFSEIMSLWKIFVLSAITSLEAPLMLLFLGAFASNKVEGMAISKGFGIIMIPMLIDYFLTGGWRLILSVTPLWWIERAVFSDHRFSFLYLIGAAIIHFIFIAFLYRKFLKRCG